MGHHQWRVRYALSRLSLNAIVRTTLDVDDDVLQAAKELAAIRGITAGKMLSELARKALTAPASPRVRNGVPLVPRRPAGSPRPTMALVNRLRDES